MRRACRAVFIFMMPMSYCSFAKKSSYHEEKTQLMTVSGEQLRNHSRFLPHPKYPRPELMRAVASPSSTTSQSGASWWRSLNG